MGRILLRDKFNKLLGVDLEASFPSDGLTRMLRAVRYGDIRRIESLIAAGADINNGGAKNTPPLSYAILRKETKTALLLIERGADVNRPDKFGRTPLHLAVQMGNIKAVKELIQAGADVNACDHYQQTPLHKIGINGYNAIDLLVQAGANVNAKDIDGNTPLHHALEHISSSIALLDHGANVNIQNEKGQTPYTINLSRYSGDRKKLARVMLRGLNDPDITNRNGQTLVHLVVLHNHTELFPDLIKSKANLKRRDHKGKTALHYAVEKGNVSAARILISHFPALLNVKDSNGYTPLGSLINKTSVRAQNMPGNVMIRALLEGGADINETNRLGQSLLHIAIDTKNIAFADYLIRKGAELNQRDETNRTPLSYAVFGKSIDLVDQLLDNGADPDTPDQRGWTLLDQLSKRGDRESSIVQRLIAGGATYNKQLPKNPEHMHSFRNTGAKKPMIKVNKPRP